jgi:NADPH:quinone reductase-like Zn-dependent oxidoreductase
MHAVTIVDGRLEWREHAEPEPGAGELLVRVEGAGLNGADLVQIKGGYPAPPGSPSDIPGLELSGTVVATGPRVIRFQEGDRVMAVVGGGAQAELTIVHERTAMPVPDRLSWAEAGGFPEVFTTAHDALFTQCGLALGERVLVHGAAGGVGIAGVQLAALAGARVVATVRHDALRAEVERIGRSCGDVTAVSADADLAELGPFDVVLELVGAPNFGADLQNLATGGRISIIGVGAGGRAELELFLLMAKRGRIHGSTLRPRPLEEKAVAAQLVDARVIPAVASGRLTVPIAATFPMREAGAAYERFSAGAKLGKIVLLRDA